MDDFVFRIASINDIPFLIDTIIEAEKSGTERLSYSTIFGLSEEEVRKFLSLMLTEEVAGCELSISSFLIAEFNGKVAAASSAWIEGSEGIPSAVLKGNLLNYTLPQKCIERALKLNEIIREIHIEYYPDTIQIGAGYVASNFRGHRLLGLLTKSIIERLVKIKPNVTSAYVQIFSCNIPSIRTYEKAGFIAISDKESLNTEILKYLPSNKKILMKKEVFTT